MLAAPLGGASSVELCDLQVGLTMAPEASGGGGGDDSGSSSSLSAGAIAGITVAAVLGCAALALLGGYILHRRRQQQAAPQEDASKQWAVADGRGPADPSEDGSRRPASEAPLPAGISVAVVPDAAERYATLGSSSRTSTGVATPLAPLFSDPSTRGSGGTSGSGRAASATDLTKLPQGFNEGEDGWAHRLPAGLGPAWGQAHGRGKPPTTPIDAPCRAAVSASDFTLIRTLGEGSFSQVWLARFCETQVTLGARGCPGRSWCPSGTPLTVALCRGRGADLPA